MKLQWLRIWLIAQDREGMIMNGNNLHNNITTLTSNNHVYVKEDICYWLTVVVLIRYCPQK